MNFAISILCAVSSSTLVALLLAWLRGGLSPIAAAIALCIGLLVAGWTSWQQRQENAVSAAPTAWEWAAIGAFALVTARIFLWVVFIDGDEIKVLSPNNLGDLSLHLTYVRYFANGVPFWPENPIFAGHALTYPIGVDFFHSLLVALGLDALRTFVWIGLIGGALVGIALWRWGRGFALFGFLANGGLAALLYFRTGEFEDFQAVHAWKSIALALFATQRGLLFALPAGLLLLCSWRTRFFQQGDGRRLPLWSEVLLYASLPLFHFHTFLFLSVLLGVWFVMHPPARGDLLRLVATAFLPATVLVWLVTGGLQGGSMLGWKAGWMWDDEGLLTWCRDHFGSSERFTAGLIFWPLNFGILPALVGALLVTLWRERDPWARALVLPALGIFGVCCFVKFAPWEWDNTKLMVWSYLAVLPLLWSKVLVRWPAWARVAGGIALFASGFLSTLGGLDADHTGYAIGSRYELDGTAAAVRSIPIAETFAGAPTYNHPLLLCGRKMVLGYLGHVASHGLAWEEPSAQLDALMRSGEDDDWRGRAASVGARYLFWGRVEDETYADAAQPWRAAARLVATGDWGSIYDLHESAPSPTRPSADRE